MRIKEIIGKPVMSADTGENVGRIDDVLFDPRHHRVMALLITDGLFSKQHVLPFHELQTVGVDTVIVHTATTMRDAKQWLNDGLAVTRSSTLHGKNVVTAEGRRMGMVRDLVADEQPGNIVALEVVHDTHVARGAHATLLHGVDQMQLSNDLIVVPESVAATRSTDR